MIADLHKYDTVIFGCGNILMGDDGFGPGVMEYLEQHHTLPAGVMAVDVGTSIRDILFDLLLSPQKPRRIFIVDAVSESGRLPGDVFELPLSRIPECKVNDFSVHQFPSLNLLQELHESGGVEVCIVAAQTGHIPDEVEPGLSSAVQAAIPKACAWLLDRIGRCS